MQQGIFDTGTIIKFLLGDLSDEERDEIEARYFANDNFFEEVSIAEEELIEAYIEGDLSGRERKLFEDRFLVYPAWRARLEFAEILKRAAAQSHIAEASGAESPVADKPPQRSRFWPSIFQPRNRAFQWAMATAALILAIAFIWALVINRQPPSEPQQAQTDQLPAPTDNQTGQQNVSNENASPETGHGQQRKNTEPEIARASRPAAALELFSSQTRGSGDLPAMKIPPGGEKVSIKLYFQEADYNNYSAALQTSGGEKKWSKDRLKASRVAFGRMIELNLPASLFSSGDYVVTLNGATANDGIDEIGVYQFKVIKK